MSWSVNKNCNGCSKIHNCISNQAIQNAVDLIHTQIGHEGAGTLTMECVRNDQVKKDGE